MSIRNDWNNFKDPMKQAGRNLKDSVQDYIDDHSDEDYDAHKQQSCIDFYSFNTHPCDGSLGIPEPSTVFSVKTGRGFQKFTFI